VCKVIYLFLHTMEVIISDIQKAEVFTILFQHIKVFTEHINIQFLEDKMYIQAMDNSHVSVIEVQLPCTWFDSYSIEEGSAYSLGVNSSMLFRILNARDKGQTITLNYGETDTDKLYIHYRGENKTEFDKHFEMVLMDIESELMEIPAIEYEAEFTLASIKFANIINQLKMFGDNVGIKCSEEKISLHSSTQESGKMFVEIKIDDLTSFVIDEGGEVELAFSLAYLHNICLFNKISKDVDVKLSTNYPMKITYVLNGDENAILMFYLAPKMNSDE
jgi:proliferating cell nuclear antigen PCNA